MSQHPVVQGGDDVRGRKGAVEVARLRHREHADAVRRGEQVATAEDRAVGVLLLELLQKGPEAFAGVLLLDGSAMHTNGREAELPRFIDEFEDKPWWKFW